MIPKFDEENFVEWTRSFNDILLISWSFLSKIESGLSGTDVLRTVKSPIVLVPDLKKNLFSNFAAAQKGVKQLSIRMAHPQTLDCLMIS